MWLCEAQVCVAEQALAVSEALCSTLCTEGSHVRSSRREGLLVSGSEACGDPGLAVELAHWQLETGKQQIDWLRLWKVESDRFSGKKVREFTGPEAAFVTEERAFPAEGAVGADSWDDVDLPLDSHT